MEAQPLEWRRRIAIGKAARGEVKRSEHDQWAPSTQRADPIDTIVEAERDRIPLLIPVRHKRMAESALAYYRATAGVMAGDLAHTPTSGITVQLCGDAHLGNFGTYASPERRQVFDVNDFDETLAGPWEWDVKRLAASAVLAAHDNGFGNDLGREAARESVAGYRRAMLHFKGRDPLQIWYDDMPLDRMRAALPTKAERRYLEKFGAKARSKNSRRALARLTESGPDGLRIRNDAPLLIPLRDLPRILDPDHVRGALRGAYSSYEESLRDDRRELLRRYRVIDAALKVVGVGSVGLGCYIVLLQDAACGSPLVLQFKQAGDSALAPYLPVGKYGHGGKRVVAGRRLMQATSDIFLGWSTNADGTASYWRQFHDMKGSANVAAMPPEMLLRYANLCGWTLAHAHGRSGDYLAIAGYLGDGDTFDRAVAEFGVGYADQNQRDYDSFRQAIAEGRLAAASE